MNRGWLAGLVAVGLVPALLLTASPITRAESPAARPYLGVLAGPMENHAGAVIREVTPKSPAAQAGLKTGDIIVKVGDKDVKNPEMLVEAIATHKPSDKLALAVMRDGKEHKMEVTLAERPQERARPKVQLERHAFLGVWGQALNEDMKKSLGVTADKGVVVMQVAPESAAAKAGLAKNDVITAVGDQMVTTPEELRSAVQKAGAGKDVTVKFQRAKEAKEVKVKLEEMPFGFGRLPGISPDMLRDGTFKLPQNFDREDVQKLFDELHKRFKDFDEAPEHSTK
jgi:S1-C subfamily serine protease